MNLRKGLVFELPPVEVSNFHTFASAEDEEEVVYACHLLADGSRDGLPCLPSACVGHSHLSHLCTFDAVGMHFDSATLKGACYSCLEGLWSVGTKVYRLQFDVVIVVYFRHIYTSESIWFALHPKRERHCLCLHARVGIEGCDGVHALVGRKDGGEGAVGIELKLLDGDAASEAASTWKFACMVEEIVVSLEVLVATVVGE